MAGLCGVLAFILLAGGLWVHSVPLILCACTLLAAAIYLDKRNPPKELL